MEESDSFLRVAKFEHARGSANRKRYLVALCSLLSLLLFIALVIAFAPKSTNQRRHHPLSRQPNSSWNNNNFTTTTSSPTVGSSSPPPTSSTSSPSSLAELNFDFPEFDFDKITSNGEDFYIQQLKATSRYCAAATLVESSMSNQDLLIKRANCGDGYKRQPTRIDNSSSSEFTVLLLGSAWRKEGIRDLSGCPLGLGQCPLSPQCRFVQSDRETMAADVAVVFQTQNLKPTASRYRVLYWREAMFPGPSAQAQRERFDFEMGVHYQAALPNPYFAETPREYLQRVNGALMPSQPLRSNPDSMAASETKFALSIISHCNAASQRDAYLQLVNNILASKQHVPVDEYGSCGKLRLPSKPLGRANEIISSYKFYFALENELQPGYVTEKLLYILALGGPVPVYFGSPGLAPNITHSKSYISVADYPSAQALVEHLLYLEKNPEALAEYRVWRERRDFTQEYLEMMAERIAGPDELLAHTSSNPRRFPRTAQCCRLCDEDFVRAAKLRGMSTVVVASAWTREEIIKRYFH